MATLGANILDPALRMAGIKRLVGSGSSTDQVNELILAVNRLLASWSCDGHKVFKTRQQDFDFIGTQKVYTIGPGADFDTVRPIHISAANLLYPTSPVISSQIEIIDVMDWASFAITDLPGTLVFQLYYDHGLDSNGWGKIYLFGQAPTDYHLQLFMWEALKNDFSAASDSFLFPPGYEKALTSNLALETELLYPHEARISPRLERQAAADLQTLQLLNATLPKLQNDAGPLGGMNGPYPWYYWQGIGMN